MSTSSTEVKVLAPSQYDLTQKVTTTPLYTYYDVYPDNGSQTITFANASATNEVQFEIPANRLINLSRTTLRFEAEVLSPVTLAAVIASAGSLVLSAKQIPFSTIRLYTRTGTNLINISNAQDYFTMSCQPSLSKEKLESEVCGGIHATVASSRITSPVSPTAATITANHPSTDLYSAAMPLSHTGAVDYKESMPPYSIATFAGHTHAAYAAAGAQPPPIYYTYELNLGKLSGTICSMDKSIMLSETLILHLQFSPPQQYMGKYNLTGVIPAVAAPAEIPYDIASLELTNISLKICQDLNKSAIAGWVQKLQSGGSYDTTIPYTTMVSISHAANSSGANTIRINRSHGSSLLRIISGTRIVVVAGDCLSNYNYENFSPAYPYIVGNGQMVKQYQTMLDGQPLQPKYIDTSKSDDWFFNKKYLTGSTVSGSELYKASFALHIDQFGGDSDKLIDSDVSDYYRSGLPISGSVMYTRNDSQKSTLAVVQNFVVVGQKSLRINNQGISVI